MKRVALWAAAVFLPACCIAARTSTVNPTTHMTLVEQLEEETPALVWWRDEDGGHSYDPDNHPAKAQLVTYCAAVWVNRDTMLTAEHCVDDINKPDDDEDEDPASKLQQLLNMLEHGGDPPPHSTWTPAGQPVLYSEHGDITPDKKVYHQAVVTAVDMVNDLALVKAEAPPPHPIAHLRQGTIHDGEELHIIGHPAGNWWTYIHGYVAAERPKYWDGKVYRPIMQVTAPIFFGNSGGGAFDLEGNLVGIADAISKVPDAAFFIPRDVVWGFLEHNRVLSPVR